MIGSVFGGNSGRREEKQWLFFPWLGPFGFTSSADQGSAFWPFVKTLAPSALPGCNGFLT